jgi:hypothetical protein
MSTGASTVWKTLSSTSFIPTSGSVTSLMLEIGAVVTDKIGDQAVTTNKIADNSINTIKLSGELITTAQIVNDAIITSKILDQAVTTDKILDQAVTTDKIANATITTAKLSANSVTTNTIANNAITTDKILAAAITPEKAYAFTAAIPDSFVLRDSVGNLSATEITANLKGNANTATSWQTSMTLKLSGDVNGTTTFNGSNSATITTILDQSAPIWAVYKASPNAIINLSGSYIQGSTQQPSNLINVTQTISTVRVRQETGTYTQNNNTVVNVTLSTIKFVEWFNENYFEYNLLPGTTLSATFSGIGVQPPNDNYILTTTNFTTTGTEISFDTGLIQTVSGNITLTYSETVLEFLNNLQIGHLVNAYFVDVLPLTSTSITIPTSGVYKVVDVINTNNFVLSSSVTQSTSGNMFIKQCIVVENYGVPNVTYLDVGRHILNFKYPFNGSQDAPFHVCFTGSGTPNAELSGLYTSSIERSVLGYQAPEYSEIRTILNNAGTLEFYDFNRTNVMLLGNRSSG